MSLLQFKEKLFSLKNDEFERRRAFDRAQVFAVASFWIIFTVVLLWYGRKQELREQAARRPPVIPEAVTVSHDRTSMPTTHVYRQK